MKAKLAVVAALRDAVKAAEPANVRGLLLQLREANTALAQVTDAPGAQQRVPEFCSFVPKGFLVTSFEVPYAVDTLRNYPKRTTKSLMHYGSTKTPKFL